jgi:arsenate reductase (glutaredoxin)
MAVMIYHNPSCGTSRNTLAMIRQSGEEPEIIEYLKTPPTRQRLVEVLRSMRMRPRELLRRKGTPHDELGLDEPKWSDDESHHADARTPDPDQPPNCRDIQRRTSLPAI